MKSKRGFTLIELLVTFAIASFFFLTLSASFVAAMKVNREVRAQFIKFRFVRPFFLVFEKDLRNMVVCSAIPFQGKETECSFPTFHQDLVRVRYLEKGEAFVRQEGERMKILIPHLKKIHLEYGYKDQEEGKIVFLPYWLDEPYNGLPKTVKVSIELNHQGEMLRFARLPFIPQGKWGVPHSEDGSPGAGEVPF